MHTYTYVWPAFQSHIWTKTSQNRGGGVSFSQILDFGFCSNNAMLQIVLCTRTYYQFLVLTYTYVWPPFQSNIWAKTRQNRGGFSQILNFVFCSNNAMLQIVLCTRNYYQFLVLTFDHFSASTLSIPTPPHLPKQGGVFTNFKFCFLFQQRK